MAEMQMLRDILRMQMGVLGGLCCEEKWCNECSTGDSDLVIPFVLR
jgi:hypothetical protein